MANPNPQNKFQKGNKVAGRKPGQLCLAFEQRRGDKRSAIFGAWFSAGIAVGEWATARAGTWDICGLPGSRIGLLQSMPRFIQSRIGSADSQPALNSMARLLFFTHLQQCELLSS